MTLTRDALTERFYYLAADQVHPHHPGDNLDKLTQDLRARGVPLAPSRPTTVPGGQSL